ncbi:MAG: (d)CMP kinase [Desulfobacterium sp.]|nr:(d)CMP kinase [Desulfobacterium sp.]
MAAKIITIDGPAGSGKTTVSKALAQRLGWIYVDTGALYRGVAFEVKRTGTDYNDDIELETLLSTLSLELVTVEGALKLLSSGCDITDRIRTPEISMLASTVSAKPRVRAALLEMQRLIATKSDAVFEGRDMGTVVFPKADHKFFLSADLVTRAMRRHGEGSDQPLCEVEKDIAKRDKNDSERKQAPLKAADDAVIIDSTDLTIEEVVGRILHEIGQ